MDCFCSLDFHLCSILSYSVLLFLLLCPKMQEETIESRKGFFWPRVWGESLHPGGDTQKLVGGHSRQSRRQLVPLYLPTASRDWMGSGAGLPSLKAHPHDALPPARSHFWKVVKSSYTALPAEDQAFKCGNLWETSHTQTTPPLPGGNSTPTPSEDIMKSAQLYQVTASFCVILQAFWLELSSSCYSLDCLLPRVVYSSRHE